MPNRSRVGATKPGEARYWINQCRKCRHVHAVDRVTAPCVFCGAALEEYTKLPCVSCGSFTMIAGRDRAQCADCFKWNRIMPDQRVVVQDKPGWGSELEAVAHP